MKIALATSVRAVTSQGSKVKAIGGGLIKAIGGGIITKVRAIGGGN
jgi:hypothetical protein